MSDEYIKKIGEFVESNRITELEPPKLEINIDEIISAISTDKSILTRFYDEKHFLHKYEDIINFEFISGDGGGTDYTHIINEAIFAFNYKSIINIKLNQLIIPPPHVLQKGCKFEECIPISGGAAPARKPMPGTAAVSAPIAAAPRPVAAPIAAPVRKPIPISAPIAAPVRKPRPIPRYVAAVLVEKLCIPKISTKRIYTYEHGNKLIGNDKELCKRIRERIDSYKDTCMAFVNKFGFNQSGQKINANYFIESHNDYGTRSKSVINYLVNSSIPDKYAIFNLNNANYADFIYENIKYTGYTDINNINTIAEQIFNTGSIGGSDPPTKYKWIFIDYENYYRTNLEASRNKFKLLEDSIKRLKNKIIIDIDLYDYDFTTDLTDAEKTLYNKLIHDLPDDFVLHLNNITFDSIGTLLVDETYKKSYASLLEDISNICNKIGKKIFELTLTLPSNPEYYAKTISELEKQYNAKTIDDDTLYKYPKNSDIHSYKYHEYLELKYYERTDVSLTHAVIDSLKVKYRTNKANLYRLNRNADLKNHINDISKIIYKKIFNKFNKIKQKFKIMILWNLLKNINNGGILPLSKFDINIVMITKKGLIENGIFPKSGNYENPIPADIFTHILNKFDRIKSFNIVQTIMHDLGLPKEFKSMDDFTMLSMINCIKNKISILPLPSRRNGFIKLISDDTQLISDYDTKKNIILPFIIYVKTLKKYNDSHVDIIKNLIDTTNDPYFKRISVNYKIDDFQGSSSPNMVKERNISVITTEGGYYNKLNKYQYKISNLFNN